MTEEKQSIKPEQLDKLVVSSSLVKAYLINMSKSLILLGILVGAYFGIERILGFNPVLYGLDLIHVSPDLALKVVIGLVAGYLTLIIFDASKLASSELVFEGDFLTYSYGALIKTTKTIHITNIIRVNFKEYSLLKVGDLIIELTGTDDKTLIIQYVSHVERNCGIINELINFKKYQQMEAINEESIEESSVEEAPIGNGVGGEDHD